MQATPDDIKKYYRLLEETPVRLASMTGSYDNERLHAKPDEDIWSVNDILAHLRACADVWGKCIGRVISEDHPTIRHLSPRTWMRRTDYPEQAFDLSLEAFTAQRNELLAQLESLAIEAWSRGATVTGITRGREQTVLSYAQRIADHEAQHLDQIAEVLALLEQPK